MEWCRSGFASSVVISALGPRYLDTELPVLDTIVGIAEKAVTCPALAKWRVKIISENTELICSRLTFSYVKKPSTKLLAFPCKCIHLLRQSPLPRYLRILHQPTRLVRGSGWSPLWMTSPNLCRSHWVGVSWDERGSECVSPACWLCSCLDVEEKGSANTVWLCCFLLDSALNFIRRFKYVSLSQPAAVVWWRYCVSPADAPREDQLHILFLFGLSYSRASISDGNFLAEPFSRLLQHQCLVGADKVWSSALHHRGGRGMNCRNFDTFIWN